MKCVSQIFRVGVVGIGALLISSLAVGQGYEIDRVALPEGVDPEIGGIAYMKDGRIAACFHQGELRIYDPKTEEWSVFATGLQEPLGIVEEADGSFVVMQRCELTRIRDRDSDGQADRFENVCDGFGVSGNYHEFAFGPAVSPEGDYFIALNVASGLGTISEEVRGPFLEIGFPREGFYSDWKSYKGKIGRMYSRVPYRGWVLKVDAKTGEVTPWASGFRSPDGIGFDDEGNLYASDNQGDWRGTSPMYHVEKGKFYGHPASLPWEEGYDLGDPLEIPVEDLDARRTKAAILFTQGSMANSPTQMLPVPEGFGPFTGQMVIGEMNRGRVLRLMLEDVNGVRQGACTPMIDGGGLDAGVHRLAFGAPGELWAGHTHLSWAGGEGLSRIRYTGKLEKPEVLDINLQPEGFLVKFTQPISTSMLSDDAVKISRYRFAYQRDYGSPLFDESAPAFTLKQVAPDAVEITIDEPLRRGFCYEIHLGGDVDSTLCYTVQEIPSS
tara:strand:- start:113 stop:1603 length:1491 start_codon:yes stop_codon:yes gene_type:complete